MALKFLKGDEPDGLSRFQREAQTAAKLNPPNIAAIHEVGESAGRHFIAMQLVEGRRWNGSRGTTRRCSWS